MAGAVQRRWLDHATTILLENVRPKESLWNVKVEAYGNKSKKKTDIEELLEEVAATSATPQGVDTKAVKGNNHPNRQKSSVSFASCNLTRLNFAHYVIMVSS